MYALHRSRIRKLRLQRGYTQKELAENAGITQEYLSAIERGSRVPSLEVFLLLAEALRVPPSILLSRRSPS
ncbi:MAG TPA: helix-turn-helix transcriptional regulator [Synergistaceae bacterium]|nr:helix-turn-helix transcriptional regulator [Synergistaceae bacterium]HPJ26599.1 helix-turn-helix transcriptional regulator [Synergistaceae bacterium]HPQ38357.1 helix-turn-helix transcriptional regulator [Synergistaceae bacterium]